MHPALRLVLSSALASASILSLASSARALSCDGHLVYVGDTSARVRAICGEPAQVSSRVETRSRSVLVRAANGVLVQQSESVSVTVETWVYDFGRQRFMEQLQFVDGVLTDMRAAGYGTSRGRSVRARPDTIRYRPETMRSSPFSLRRTMRLSASRRV